jgi:1,2-diacylglycerol 3-alpha-glucosyltransferase
MKLPINIVLLTPGFAANEMDTTAIPSLQHYIRFMTTNFDDISLRIVTFQYPFKSGHYIWNGIPVYSAGGGSRKFMRLITWLKVLGYLRKLHKREGIDIVHSFWLTEASLIGLVFCRLKGIKFLATSMGQDVKPENKYLGILRYFSFRLTIISQFQYGFIRYMKKLHILKVVPFGIDNSYFNEIQVNRTVDILGVGSLNSVKNYPEFVNIIETVARMFPVVRCRIIGEGVKRAEIEKLIQEKRLKDNMVLTGNLDYSKTIEEMQHGKILLHTSTFEGQALVITEALAAGLYVVCHPVGIAASLKSDKLFTALTQNDLSLRILEILRTKDLDFKPEVHYTINETCKEYYKIYLEMVK